MTTAQAIMVGSKARRDCPRNVVPREESRHKPAKEGRGCPALRGSADLKFAAKFGDRNNSCHHHVPGLQQVFVARYEKIRMRYQGGGQKGCVFGVTRKVRFAWGAAHVHRPLGEQVRPTLQNFLTQAESGACARHSCTR